MAHPRLTRAPQSEPVRLELTSGQGRQTWELYSENGADRDGEDSPFASLLSDLPSIAWQQRRLLGLGALIGLALAVLYLMTTDPVFMVRALVHIEQRDSVLQQYDAVRPGSTFIATQSEVIHNPEIVSDALRTLGAPDQPEPGWLARAMARLKSLLPGSEVEAGDPHAAAVMAALGGLSATPVSGTDVMAITYRTGEPESGVAFLDALIDRYRGYLRELETAAHGEGLELLHGQERELRAQLDELETRYAELHAGTMVLGREEDSFSVEKTRLEEHARAHVEAQGRRIELENRLALQARSGSAQRDQVIGELKSAEAALAELLSSRSELHPDVRQMRHRIKLLEGQVRRSSAADFADLRRELNAAKRTEEMLAGLYQEEWAAAKGVEAQRLEESRIVKEMDRVSSKHDAVLTLLRDKELRVLSLQSGHAGTVIRVLDPPAAPLDPIWPNPGLVLLGLGFLGVMGGLGMGLFEEYRARLERIGSRVQQVKPFKTAAAAVLRGADASGVFNLLERRELDRPDVLRALTYHRIGDPDDRSCYPGLVSASPSGFASQMEFLKERHCFLSMEDVLNSRRDGTQIPPRALVVTFDDAYSDFAEHAWPVLKALDIPATVFVPTAYPGQPARVFWWERLFGAIETTEKPAIECTPLGRLEIGDPGSRGRAFRRLRALFATLSHEDVLKVVDDVVRELGESGATNDVLGWDALRSLAADGVTLCSHTRTHPTLDRLSPEEIRTEVRRSVADLRREIGDVLPVFAYPEGRFSESTVRVIEEEGIELAFTTRRGLNDMTSADPLLLRRIPVTPRATEAVLRAQLMGWTASLSRNAPSPTA